MKKKLLTAIVTATTLAALGFGSSSGAAHATESFDRYSFTNYAGSRSYKVYVPPNHSGSRLPLLVDLHGCGSNADEEARWSRFNELAAARRFLVAYPEQA